MMAEREDKRAFVRRATDDWKFWIPFMVALAGQALMLGVVYGQLSGQLEHIDYRLRTIERVLKIGP